MFSALAAAAPNRYPKYAPAKPPPTIEPSTTNTCPLDIFCPIAHAALRNSQSASAPGGLFTAWFMLFTARAISGFWFAAFTVMTVAPTARASRHSGDV